jgi:hypothetical protein
MSTRTRQIVKNSRELTVRVACRYNDTSKTEIEAIHVDQVRNLMLEKSGVDQHF